MDVSRPYGVIAHPLDSEVLHVLAGTSEGLTGRAIARLSSAGSQEGIRRSLGRLAGEGVVRQKEAGNAILFELNRDHLAAPAIEQLTDLRRVLLARLAETLNGWAIPPLHASMFGSAARGDGDASSDIDLFVVRPGSVDRGDPTWRAQLDRLSEDVSGWTGNRAGIAEVSEQDLPGLRRRRPGVVESLEADAIRLTGPDVATILREKD
jgi:DNA-binding transcriptional ArsR family regulator